MPTSPTPSAAPRPWSRPALGVLAAITLVTQGACGREASPAGGTYAPVVQALETFIAHELEAKGLPALSIALVDDQELVWAAGFGMEDPDAGVPATAETVYRVGSVSKLFTDIGVMQLVQGGELDLDAPVSSVLPDFAPENPFGAPITLRQLMSHRSGLVREPPVGHYFDPTEPSLAATVESLNHTTLVYPPESRFKYSNAAIAVVGYVLESTQSTPFPEYLGQAVLEPLGMEASSFAPTSAIQERLASAVMWSYDGREFPAPTFQLGMAPAGSMYAPVTDLARFMSALFAGGEGVNGSVVSPETLQSMWTPQFAEEEGATTGGGLGFAIGSLDGHRTVGHGGAIYGFATELAALPEEKLGVVVATTRDFTNGVAGRIADTALRMMLAHRDGAPLPGAPITEPLQPGVARGVAGRYADGDRAVDLVARGDRLFVHPSWGGYNRAVRSGPDGWIADDRLGFGPAASLDGDQLRWDGGTYDRTQAPVPPPAPDALRDYIGEYGWDHNTLIVFERDGALWALIEWLELDPLERVSADEFRFPADRGLYHGEGIRFERDASGRVTAALTAGIRFERLAVGPADGAVFRIEPVRPVAELRDAALAASPPTESGDFVEPDLVELTSLDPGIRLDIRYAGTDNFMSTPFYGEPRAFLQRPAAEALVRVHRALEERGYGLLVHDAYRPWYVTKMFWDATPEGMKQFVANPANGSRHNRGAAVDLTLFDRDTGRPLVMTGVYDEFSERSYPDYVGGTSLQRWHRELLRDAMEAEGFTVYEYEWWHFDFEGWNRFPIMNRTFEEL